MFNDANSKKTFVNNVFSAVANKYDIMNDIMSFGMQRLWKKRFAQYISVKSGIRIADLSCGTGDIANLMIEKFINSNITNYTLDLVDPNNEMLEIAKSRFRNNLNTKFTVSGAEAMPFEDNTFDILCVAFGMRNFNNRALAMSEILRVLKPNGLFLCLEFSDVTDCLSFGYKSYLNHFLPFVGGVVAKNAEAYQYLAKSIQEFPSANVLKDELSSAKFKDCCFEKLSCGIVAIHYARK